MNKGGTVNHRMVIHSPTTVGYHALKIGPSLVTLNRTVSALLGVKPTSGYPLRIKRLEITLQPAEDYNQPGYYLSRRENFWYTLMEKLDGGEQCVIGFCVLGFEHATGIRLTLGETCYIQRVKTTYK